MGPNETDSDDRTGGIQFRVDSDGSLVALIANKQEIVRSKPGAVANSPAIVAFSMDSVGNCQLYVYARPVGGSSTNVDRAPAMTARHRAALLHIDITHLCRKHVAEQNVSRA